MIPRDQVDELLGFADAEIASALARLNVQGSGAVTVQQDLVSVAPAPELEPVVQRGWFMAIFAEVSMNQVYGTSEPGQISAVFEYEPRYVTPLPSTLGETDYFTGNSGVTMLPRIITGGDGPQAGEIYAGVVFQESIVVPTPSTLDKQATITFYVRGYFSDASSPAVPVFADGFAVGSVLLTIKQSQFITTGDPLEVVLITSETQVTATYAGRSATYTAFQTDPFTPGDSTATLSIVGAQRP